MCSSRPTSCSAAHCAAWNSPRACRSWQACVSSAAMPSGLAGEGTLALGPRSTSMLGFARKALLALSCALLGPISPSAQVATVKESIAENIGQKPRCDSASLQFLSAENGRRRSGMWHLVLCAVLQSRMIWHNNYINWTPQAARDTLTRTAGPHSFYLPFPLTLALQNNQSSTSNSRKQCSAQVTPASNVL